MKAVEAADPNDPMLLLELGNARGLRTEIGEADRYFERAVAAARDQQRVLLIAAVQARGFLRYDLAEKYLERAVAAPGATADTLAKLAEIKERLRDVPTAQSLLDRALRSDAKCQMALLVKARLSRLTGHLEESEKAIRSILGRTDRENWSTRVRGWFELAAILDRQNRYDEAYAALTTAKGLLLPQAPVHGASRKAAHRYFRQAATQLTEDHLERWRDDSLQNSGRRFALIAGHPRSGTTLLEQILDAHSSIVSAEETNIFFDTSIDLMTGSGPKELVPLLDSLPSARLQAARETYFQRMDAFVGKSMQPGMLIDKNPSLTALIPTLLRVVPQARIIIAVRDPRDVCLSCFMQFLPLTPVSAMYLKMETLVEEYCAVMGFWLSIKPLLKSCAMEVRYEDFVTDVRGQTERILQHLDLEWEPNMLDFAARSRQKLVRSPTYAEVARPISQGAIGRWLNYRKHLEPHLEKLAPFIRAFGYEEENRA